MPACPVALKCLQNHRFASPEEPDDMSDWSTGVSSPAGGWGRVNDTYARRGCGPADRKEAGA
ncbi:hypothetical protein GCM10010341_03680 [Streptomyces noursei]|nr:hypothetical protein GCM10010341_03680 [Streptomyces noursei]